MRKKELAATARLARQEASVDTPTPSSSELVPSLIPIAPTEREGDTNRPKKRNQKKTSCTRPGCEVDWIIDPRTPHKKFCSPLCDNALRAAIARVERYYLSRGYVGAITASNSMQVLLAKPGSRVQLRAFESVVLRC